VKTLTAVLIAVTAALTLAFAPYDPDAPIVLEHDVKARDVCLAQLLAFDDAPYTAGTIIGTLNYVDRQYGGPCAAVDHYLEHRWY